MLAYSRAEKEKKINSMELNPKIDTNTDVVNQFTPHKASSAAEALAGQAGEKRTQPKIDVRADVVNQFTGEKWYYTDIVKEHFFNPRNLMLEEPDETQYSAVGMVGSPACILPSTLVQLNPKLEQIDKTPIGEAILGHDGYFHRVERVLRPKSSAKLVSIKNQLGEITATADHLIYAAQVPRKKDSPFVHTKYKKRIPASWVHAGDLNKGDIVLYPIPKETRRLGELILPTAIRKKWDFKSKPLPPKVPITADLLELFGYFVAEGSSKDGELAFTFGEGEQAFAERVKYLLQKHFSLTASIRARPSNHRIDVTICNIYLSRLFRDWFGVLAENKKVPEFILFLDPALQRGLLKGLWSGDGHFSANRSQPRAGFVTVSKILSHQAIWFLLRQKIVSSIYKEEANIKNGVSRQASYRIHIGDMASLERLAGILEISFIRDPSKRHAVESWFDDNYLYTPVRGVGTTQFKGRLYNFEVAESHTYATDAFLVHNCGDMMKMWLKIEDGSEKVLEMKWRTFGCGSAIAATSMFSVMVTENGGVAIDEALKIKPQHIMERLGGLPNRKIHCSVLADKAFRKAANDYFRRSGQVHRVIIEGARVIDPVLNITDKDIEEAVLEGAVDLDSVQKKLKVGVGSPDIITEVEQLIRFYKEKYYG